MRRYIARIQQYLENLERERERGKCPNIAYIRYVDLPIENYQEYINIYKIHW